MFTWFTRKFYVWTSLLSFKKYLFSKSIVMWVNVIEIWPKNEHSRGFSIILSEKRKHLHVPNIKCKPRQSWASPMFLRQSILSVNLRFQSICVRKIGGLLFHINTVMISQTDRRINLMFFPHSSVLWCHMVVSIKIIVR